MESRSSSTHPAADVPISSPHAPPFVIVPRVLFPAHPPPVTSQSATMQHSSPFLLLLLAASPLAAAAQTFYCVGGAYKANSTYEANLRRLAAVLPAETASSRGLQASRAVGSWPNRVRASSRCEPPGVNSSSSCAACVAGAFREAETACPYDKKVVVLAGNCTLRLGLAEFPRPLALGEGFSAMSFGEDGSIIYFHPLGANSWFRLLGPTTLILQAIGFAWLFFMLLQEWRDKKKSLYDALQLSSIWRLVVDQLGQTIGHQPIPNTRKHQNQALPQRSHDYLYRDLMSFGRRMV